MKFQAMVFFTVSLALFSGFALTDDAPSSAKNGYTTPIDVTVDTGSHTCSKIGQDHKAYKEIYAGDSRYFINESLGEVSKYGAGGCEFNSDGGAVAYEKRKFCVTDVDGQPECTDRLVRVVVRAYADCTNNPSKISSRVGTECRFTATSKRGLLAR